MNLIKKIVVFSLSLQLSFGTFLFLMPALNVEAALATQSQVQMSDSRPSQTGVTYTMTFVNGSSYTIHCVVVQFATNADMTGGNPSGMSNTSGAYGSETGLGTNAHWAFYDGTGGSVQQGYLQFEDSTGDALTAGNYATISATTVTNTSLSTFYAQITTYSGAVSAHSCSTQADQSNVIALSTVAGVATTVTVSPTLTISIANYGSAVNGSGDSSPVTTTSTTIPFGTVAAGSTAWGSQTATVSTNAANGYNLYVSDTKSLTDTNNDTIRNQAGTPAAPNSFDGSSSQSSFGYTADGNGVTFGSNKWAGLGSSATQYLIAFRTASVNSDTTHVEYKVEPSNTQPPGTYSTTVIYTAVPSF